MCNKNPIMYLKKSICYRVLYDKQTVRLDLIVLNFLIKAFFVSSDILYSPKIYTSSVIYY